MTQASTKSETRRWFETQELVASDGTRQAYFGASVAIGDGVVVIGAPEVAVGSNAAQGVAYVFTRQRSSWLEQQRLTAPEAAPGSRFGSSVAVSSSTIFVGAPGAGAAYVFAQEDGLWVDQQTLRGEQPDADRFGSALAVSGDTAIVGAPGATTLKAYVFQRSSQGWARTQELAPNDGWSFEFGSAVALSDGTAVVAAPGEPVASTRDRGAVYVYRTDSWAPQKLVAAEGELYDRFGSSVAIAGASVIVGAPSSFQQGAGFVSAFERSDIGWTEARFEGAGATSVDFFGASAAASADTLLIGAPGTWVGSSGGQGVAFAYQRDEGGWAPQQRLVAEDGELGDAFGVSVALWGGTAVIGAPDKLVDANDRQGAAYIQTLLTVDGAACDSDAACGRGHCSTGTCCDRPCGPCGTCETGTCVELRSGSSGDPACAPYVCTGSHADCPTSCRSLDDCSPDHYCDQEACVGKRSNGASCAAAEQCQSQQCVAGRCLGDRLLGADCSDDAQCDTGHCADGVCCDSACDGQCEACVAGTPGTCSAVLGDPHGARPQCARAGTTCGGACDGQARTVCGYPANTKRCGSLCSNDTQTDSACDGHGECVPGRSRPCSNLICQDAFSCKTSCASSSDCVSGFACDAFGQCVPGAACVDDHTSLGANGTTQDCTPYRCDAHGSCKTDCSDVRDCAAHSVCDFAQACVPPPVAGSGLGCSYGRAHSVAWGPTWLLCVVCLLAAGWLRSGSSQARARRRREAGKVPPRSAWARATGATAMVAAALALACTERDPVTGKVLAAESTDTLRWIEAQELRADDERGVNRFGYSVALSGTTAIIGALTANGAPDAPHGAAYAFVESGGTWSQQQKLASGDEAVDDLLGWSVAISGDTCIVGAPASPLEALGAAYLFEREASSWGEPQKLVASDGAPGNRFGYSVAIAGDVALVSEPTKRSVAVFERSQGGWTERQRLTSDDPDDDAFGDAVALSTDTIVIGAPEANSWKGIAYVFTRDELGTSWVRRQALASSGKYYEELGRSVAISGDTIVVGALRAPSGDAVGTAYVFERSGETWSEQQAFVAGDGKSLDRFGASVAVSGDTVIVGTDHAEAAYVFTRSGSAWTRQKLVANDDAVFFGSSVAVSEATALVGAKGPNDDSGPGAVYVQRLLGVNGRACNSAASCGSGHCAAGVCCDSACGPCGACATGQCLELSAGSLGEPSCGDYRCSGSGVDCPTSCNSASDCVTTHYCEGGECVAKRANGAQCQAAEECESEHCGAQGRCLGRQPSGAPCADDVECETGLCTDGVCCDRRCSGQCEACDTRGSVGVCSAVAGAPRGDRSACAGAGTTCGGVCDAEERNSCAYPSHETTCGGVCSEGTQTDSACNGQGECSVGDQRSCGNLRCADASNCKTSCASDDDCLTGFSCDADGRCGPGASCADEHTSLDANGTLRDCTPYRCDTSGNCKMACSSKFDCSEPNVCDLGGDCIPPPAPNTDSAGCSSSGRGGSRQCALLPLSVSMMAVRRRRRRAPERRSPESVA